MNKKTILSIVTILLITCISISAFAANDPIDDLSNSITGGNNTTNNTTTNNTITDNTTNNTTNNTTPNNSTKGNTTNNNTTSSYTESKIPYAGPAETIIIFSLFIICGAIGVYTFLKLSEYSNI